VLLGVTMSKVRRMEASGALHAASIGVGGVRRFDRKHVEAVARVTNGSGAPPPLTKGEVMARTWEGLRAGRSLVDLVVELRRPIAELRELRRLYHEELGGALVLEGPERRELARLAGRAIRSSGELLTLFRRLARAARRSNQSEGGV